MPYRRWRRAASVGASVDTKDKSVGAHPTKPKNATYGRSMEGGWGMVCLVVEKSLHQQQTFLDIESSQHPEG